MEMDSVNNYNAIYMPSINYLISRRKQEATMTTSERKVGLNSKFKFGKMKQSEQCQRKQW